MPRKGRSARSRTTNDAESMPKLDIPFVSKLTRAVSSPNQTEKESLDESYEVHKNT